jgi:PleD family two-component response regulator
MAQPIIAPDNAENQEITAIAAAIVAGSMASLATQLSAASYTGGTLATLKASLEASLATDVLTGLSNARQTIAKSPRGFDYQIS